MSVIDSYLDTLFAPYPDTARMREARIELRDMMEDSVQGHMGEGLTESQALGRVIADFGSLEEVAGELGIDRELGRAAHGAHPDTEDRPTLDLPRAQEYAAAARGVQGFSAASIVLFVLCPAPLMLAIAVHGTVVPEPAPWAIGIGLVLLLVLVAAGVVLMTVRGARLAGFEDVTEGTARPSPEVRRYAASLRTEHARTRAIGGAVATTLWILAAAPVVLTAFAADGDSSSVLPLYGVVGTLVMVALGIAFMFSTSWSSDVAETLLSTETAEESLENSSSPAVRAIAAVYWPVFAGVYLAWSFFTGDWDRTWIIWPVAGVLYAALWALNGALDRPEERRPAR